MGCGSTYYLSLSAASLFQSLTGIIARALPSSELLLFPESVFSKNRVLLIAISRSGKTSETLRVVEEFKKKHYGDVVVITNYSDSPLAELGDISLSINAGQEESVAQTRFFSSMLVAVTAMSELLGSNNDFGQYKDALVSSGKRLIYKYQSLAEELGNDHITNQVFFLGSGSLYGLASEISLKLKEMSQTVTESFHSFEFRHGLISMVDNNTLVIGLISESVFEDDMEVIKDVQSFGAKTITIGEKGTDIEFNSGLKKLLRGVLYMPVMQLIAYYRAVSFSKNPDSPRNITSVVKLDMRKE